MQQMSIRKKIVYSLVVCALGAIGFGAYQSLRPITDGIAPYNAARDRAFIIDQFKQNWYCLVSDRLTFSPEHMLDTKSASEEPEDFGTAEIYVYVEDKKPAGFLVIYPKYGQGRILFLEVAQEYRKKGYGRKMMNFALNLLRKRGYVYTDLYTRTVNTPARGLYSSLGFFEIDRNDEGFITYRRPL